MRRPPTLLRALAAAIPILLSGIAPIAMAQTSAYYIAEFVLKDPEAFKPYAQNVAKTVEPYGGVYLARGGKTVTLEGAPPKRIIVMRFKSMDDAQRWYASPEYSALRPHRQKAGETRNFLVEGLDPP